MNLKAYLVEKKNVKSETNSKNLIENGYVKVNGRKVLKPTIPVDDRDDITITDEEKVEVPESYWVMKKIQDNKAFVKKDDFVIDIESMDGGFPLFLEEFAEVLVLTKGNPLFENFDFPVKEFNPRDVGDLVSEKADVLINELEIDLIRSFQIFNDLMKFVKSGGKVLVHLTTKNREKSEVESMSRELFGTLGFGDIDIFTVDKKMYGLAKKV
ncbi:MAG: S4 domain-containing protein [Candidatus Aenigmatarchaeota archaeon]